MSDINLNITEEIEDVNLSIIGGSVQYVSGGEANTVSNLGGGEGLFTTKAGVDLPFKSLTEGTNITLTPSGTEIEIAVTATIFGAGNGLTENTGNLDLGATLVDDVSLDGDYTYGFEIVQTGPMKFSADYDVGSGNIIIETLASAGNSRIQLDDSGTITVTTENDSMKYAADYSGNYVDRSFVDKGYVDTQIAAISSTSIEDGDQTTGLYTEETADRLVGHSAGTGTDLIFEIFEGSITPVSVFEIDGNGDILNNGDFMFSKKGNAFSIATKNAATNLYSSICIGNQAGLNFSTTSQNSVLIGPYAGRSGSGTQKFCLGYYSGYNTSGTGQIFVGSESGHNGGSENYKVGIGHRSGAGPAGGIFIGGFSGDFLTGTDTWLLIDPLNRTNESGEIANSLIIAKADASPLNQYMRTNSKLCVNVAPLTNMVAGDAVLEGGSLILKEITTPTADANYGKVYTKSDNKLYFQDGAGSEHEIAFV